MPRAGNQYMVSLDGTGVKDSRATETYDGVAIVRLWDCLDQSWSGATSRAMAYEKNMAKVIAKCSACDFTTSAEVEPVTQIKQVQQHVTATWEQVQEHRGAILNLLTDGTGHQCTGCGIIFALGKNRAQRHLTRVLEAAVTHVEVDALLMRRYALEPSEPVILRREHVYSAESVVGPVASQVERKHRKRHRSRRGGRPAGTD